jgi:hypothetical protein
MQCTACFGSTAGNHDATADIQKLPTPPDSGRSFYSATAQTVSGHQTDNTAFCTPESSLGSVVSVSSQPSLDYECQIASAFPNSIQPPSKNPSKDELSVVPVESTSRSRGDEKSEKTINGRSSPFGPSPGSEAVPGKMVPELGWLRGPKDQIHIRTDESVKCDAAHHAPEFGVDGVMSEAYELIPGPDSPTSSDFCFQAPNRTNHLGTAAGCSSCFPEHDGSCREDEFLCRVPSFTNEVFSAQPDSVTLWSDPHNQSQTLLAIEPVVSTGPPIFMSSPSQESSEFSSIDDARESILRLSSLLQQLQHLHGECNVDVLLTCFRLASAHQFVKNLFEAKSLFMRCLQMSIRYECIRNVVHVLFNYDDSLLGSKHLQTRRIVVLLHDLEIELQRQQRDLEVIDVTDSRNLSHGKRLGHSVSTNGAFVSSRFFKETSSVKGSMTSPQARRDMILRPKPHGNLSHVRQGQLLNSRQKGGVKSCTENSGNGSSIAAPVQPSPESLLEKERPISPTFLPLPFRAVSRVQTSDEVNRIVDSPSAKAAVSVSPTFARVNLDESSFSVQSAGNESSVSPTFNCTFSPLDSMYALSNVKQQASTPKPLAAELEALNEDIASNLLAFNPEVFDVDCLIEKNSKIIAEYATNASVASQRECVERARSLTSEVPVILNPTQPIPKSNQRAEFGYRYSPCNHPSDKNFAFFESAAQTDLLFSSAESLDELNARTLHNLMQHRLVECPPNLSQIFYPVTSSLAYVLCDLNAGPAALGRRFSDSINQLRPEHETPISPKKVSQGKCLKVILMQPPQMQISNLFSYDSLCAHECFLYMNTESTVEIQSCCDVFSPTSMNHGSASSEISKLPSRLSMNEFLLLASTICSWNRQSHDHVCCILMDVVFGARMSALLVGMLSLAVGRCLDARDAEKWLENKGDCRCI